MENTALWKVARIPALDTDSVESATMVNGNAGVTMAGMARTATCFLNRTAMMEETMTKVQNEE